MDARLLVTLILLSAASAGCLAPGATNGHDAAGADGPGSDADAGECHPMDVSTNNQGVDAGSQATVSNQPGAFSYSRSGVVTAASHAYPWENPSGAATFSGSLTGAGRITIQAYDACGQLVMERTLIAGTQASSESFLAGKAGEWVIQIGFEAFSGSVSFSLSG